MAVSREKVIQTAERYVGRGKVEAAIREYRKVLQDNPRDTTTLNRVGDLYARIEKIPEAISLFIRIAEHYTEDGFFVKAIAIYKKIIKLDPTRLEIYERLAELYHRQKLVNEARTQYQVLVDYYQKHDEVDQAIRICHRMLDLEPTNPTHRARLASLLEEKGAIPEAIAEYTAIAEQLLADGQAGGAAQVYEKALDVQPDDLQFITDATLKLKESGAEGVAARFLAAAIRRNPQADQVRRLLVTQEKPPPERPPRPTENTRTTEPEAPQLASGSAPQAEPTLAEETAVSFDEEFILDLDDDVPAPTQVQPPPDMADQAPRASFSEESTDITAMAAEAEPMPEQGASIDDAFELSLGSEAELDLSEILDEEIARDEDAIFIDRARLEQVASEVHPHEIEQEEDLITEAEVLAKYGLREKALERLEEVFALNPRHLGAYALQISIYMEEGKPERVVILANELSAITQEMGQAQAWEQVRHQLLQAGYRFEGERKVVGVPGGTQSGVTSEAGALSSEPPPREAQEPVDPPANLLEMDLDFADPPTLPGLADLGLPTPYGGESELPGALVEEPALEDDTALSVDEAIPEVELEIEDALVVDEGVIEEGLEVEEGLVVDEGLLVDDPASLAAASVIEPLPAAEDLLDADALYLPEEDLLLPGEEPDEAPTAVESPDEAPPPRKRPRSRNVSAVLDELASVFGLRRRASKPAATSPGSSALESPAAVPGPVIPSAPTEASMEAELEAALDSIALPGADGSAVPSEAPAEAENIEWLDELPQKAEPDGMDVGEEESFFVDLASEIEEELAAEEEGQGEELFRDPREQSLEEIVEGFKRGVAEHLSPEDYETHFNLGIAYHEMGLLDEAIGEFQLAAKHPDRLVDCCSMLGLCFLDKGLPELAIKWYRKAIQYPGLSEDEVLGLLYDLGNAYLNADDRENAYRTFVEIYGMNTNYRDVVARIEELGR